MANGSVEDRGQRVNNGLCARCKTLQRNHRILIGVHHWMEWMAAIVVFLVTKAERWRKRENVTQRLVVLM